MHDSLAYQRDVEIADVDDWRDEQPAISRRGTKDYIVHVLVNGTYHRRSPGLGVTACGEPFHSQFAPIRREELRHPLSRSCGCFTAFEIAKADETERNENP